MKHLSLIISFSILVLILLGYISSSAALLLGFLLALTLGNPYPLQTPKVIGFLLKISIIGLGFGISLNEAIAISKEGFIITLLSILLTIALGFVLVKFLKIDKKIGFLLTSGTAICGGSAIAAISPIIRANHLSISIAISIIFFLNSIALFVFPPIGAALAMTQKQFGLWCAIAIHDTSSVVGAALEYGDEALQIATTVKLARTLWIIPLSFLAIFIFKSNGKKVKIPFFILGFILTILLNSYNLVSENISTEIFAMSKKILIFTLFLVGINLSINDLKKVGFKPIIYATILWVFISVFALIYIVCL